MPNMPSAPIIVLAPDSFKGSLSAEQACAAMSVGLRRVFPHATLHACPMADGGEGTLAALLSRGGTTRQVTVRGATGVLREAATGLFTDQAQIVTAVVETAEIVGITDPVGMAEPIEMRSSIGLGGLAGGIGRALLRCRAPVARTSSGCLGTLEQRRRHRA